MENTDSLAPFRATDGTVFVAATSKWGKRIDLFDAKNGNYARSITHETLVRPNGIAAASLPVQSSKSRTKRGDAERDSSTVPSTKGDAQITAKSSLQLLLVVDRDAPGLFIFDANSGALLANDRGDMKNPYGIATTPEDDALLIFVTDVSRPPTEMVTRYRLIAQAQNDSSRAATASDDGVLDTTLLLEQLGTFGDTNVGRIGTPESIVIDPARKRIYLCDEDRDARNVKVYDLEGNFTGTTFGDGIINGDPEGIVIVSDNDAGDFILVTDQTRRITAWHAFDAASLNFITSFTGAPRIANTDGICIFEGAISRFKSGGLFAVHDDADVRAYELADVIRMVRAARVTE